MYLAAARTQCFGGGALGTVTFLPGPRTPRATSLPACIVPRPLRAWQAIAWRIFAASNTFFAAVVLSKGKAGVAGKIAGTDSVFKTVLFYFYERVWALVSWGKEFEKEA